MRLRLSLLSCLTKIIKETFKTYSLFLLLKKHTLTSEKGPGNPCAGNVWIPHSWGLPFMITQNTIPRSKLPMKRGNQQSYPVMTFMNIINNEHDSITLSEQSFHASLLDNNIFLIRLKTCSAKGRLLASYSVLMKSWLLEGNLQSLIY